MSSEHGLSRRCVFLGGVHVAVVRDHAPDPFRRHALRLGRIPDQSQVSLGADRVAEGLFVAVSVWAHTLTRGVTRSMLEVAIIIVNFHE